MTATLVPNATDSERAVLSACMESMSSYTSAVRTLSADDWYVPAHAAIWAVMGALFGEHGSFDMIAVHQKLHGVTNHQVLLSLVGLPAPGSLSYHCQQIIAAAAARALVIAATRAKQKTEQGLDPLIVAEEAISELRTIQRMGQADVHTEVDYLDILERCIDPAQFVVPGLIGRSERVILTAPEGYGKSSLLRQIGGCSAAGLHPFNIHAAIRPVKVLIVDAENPMDINTAEYQRLGGHLAALEHQPSRGMLVVEECGPLNLLDSRQAAKLCAQVERLAPELIVIGPIYQLHEDNPNDEGPARKLSAVLDRLRSLSGASLITEAHTPHSDGPQGQVLRPYGASLWKRWPDFGYCLHPAVRPKDPSQLTDAEYASISIKESSFTPWRGQRAERAWPKTLRMGRQMLWEVA